MLTISLKQKCPKLLLFICTYISMYEALLFCDSYIVVKFCVMLVSNQISQIELCILYEPESFIDWSSCKIHSLQSHLCNIWKLRNWKKQGWEECMGNNEKGLKGKYKKQHSPQYWMIFYWKQWNWHRIDEKGSNRPYKFGSLWLSTRSPKTPLVKAVWEIK